MASTTIAKHLLLAWVACVASAGCAESEVKSRFVAAAACPAERTAVREIGCPPPQAPPPEIAADAQRLAVYRDAHACRRRLFEAEGCGERRVYECDHAIGGHHFCVLVD